MQVSDLIYYNHIVRGLYFDSLTKLPWTHVVEPKGLSFDSIRNVFLHLTLVEDRWISYYSWSLQRLGWPRLWRFQEYGRTKEVYVACKGKHGKLSRQALCWRIKPSNRSSLGRKTLLKSQPWNRANAHGYRRHDSLRWIVSGFVANGFRTALHGFLAIQTPASID